MPYSAQQYANLARDAYEDIDIKKYIDNEEIYELKFIDYKILEHYSDKETDYQGTIYQRVDTGEIFVAHRGTASVEDGIVDYLMATRAVNLQIPHALTLTEIALQEAKEYAERNKVSVPQVNITGHSLGGTLAEVSAYEYGLKAVTFNGYGSVGIAYQNLEGDYKTIPNEYDGDITNHMMAGDIVNIANPHLGQEFLYVREEQIDSLRYWNYGDGNPDNNRMWVALGVQTIKYDTHSMSNFINNEKGLSILWDAPSKQLVQDYAGVIAEFRQEIQDNKDPVLDQLRAFEEKAFNHIAEHGEGIKDNLPRLLERYLDKKLDEYKEEIDSAKNLFERTDEFKNTFDATPPLEPEKTNDRFNELSVTEPSDDNSSDARSLFRQLMDTDYASHPEQFRALCEAISQTPENQAFLQAGMNQTLKEREVTEASIEQEIPKPSFSIGM